MYMHMYICMYVDTKLPYTCRGERYAIIIVRRNSDIHDYEYYYNNMHAQILYKPYNQLPQLIYILTKMACTYNNNNNIILAF